MSNLSRNLIKVRQNIMEAVSQTGRHINDITMVAVTKTLPVPVLEEAVILGLNDFGENRVQELEEKAPFLTPTIRWHMIGHLQTNKVKYIIDKVYMVHSLDSLKLAGVLQEKAAELERVVPVLVQVNVAGEDTKYGIGVEEAAEFCAEAAKNPNLKVAGLMTIAPYEPDPEDVRPVFRDLRILSDRVRSMNIPGVTMDYLSMGMSNDYKVAIEEGSNIIRIGTGIFGERN